MLKWLVRLLNGCSHMKAVPMCVGGAFIMPLHKRKGNKNECSNSRGINH